MSERTTPAKPSSPMRILLTNDDGLTAPGIVALHRELCKLGTVLAVAPLTVQSATSHGVTFHTPLMVRKIMVNEIMEGYAVDGRPADCVKLAIEQIWPEVMGKEPPDLVVSGMNMGCNVGIHILYSGTVGAAIEAAFLGLPSIAVSMHIKDELEKDALERVRWDIAARHGRETIEKCLKFGPLEAHSVLNINLPPVRSDVPCPPMKVVPMNLAAMQDAYEKRVSPNGQDYYWTVGDGMTFQHLSEGSDVETMLNGFVTITPLQYDLTDHARMRTWIDRFKQT